MIEITKPFLPPFEEYTNLLTEIWDRNWLTNNGPVSKKLELLLEDYLKVRHFTLVSNGTISLQIAFKALNLTGEVITTPFSYVATTSALVWGDLKPVFVDIDPDTFNIDANKIEQSINDNTSAILATHVFGCPCDVEKIEQIAIKYNLKVIYDAAHAFGVEIGGQSIFNFGDVSSLSMHATKLFHTIEGGGLITNSKDLAFTFSKMRNFGHHGFDEFISVGVNAKCSEVHAAMGVINLRYIDDILKTRKQLYQNYFNLLKNCKALKFQKIDFDGLKYNHSYFPVVFEEEEDLNRVTSALNKKDVFPRRYFYPSLNKLSYLKGQYSCPVAENTSRKILCLPLFYELKMEETDHIVDVILKNIVE